MKKIVSLMLVLVMLLGMMPLTVLATDHTHTYENSICTGCGKTVSPYLQQLPEDIIGCTNLYDILTPVKGYYTATKYDTTNGEVLSVVIPVEPGDRIAASSFASRAENMGSVDGIRVTYLLGKEIVTSLSAGDVYNAYTADGYITVPEGVDTVSIPWWKPSDSNWLTLSQVSKNYAVHSPVNASAQEPTCTESGYTAGEICDICGVSLSGREEIAPAGHSYSGDICTVCGAIDLYSILSGKYVSILGDSISTFNGYSNDATVNTTIGDNAPRYDVGTADTKPGSYCLLESVNDTWWMHFANRTGMTLLVNNSWAGSQVFGGQTSDGRVIPAAYLDRCVNLHDNTLENNPNNAAIDPDVIFLYLGINDYNFNRSNVGSGAVDYAGLVSSDGTYVAPTSFGEAYAIMLHKMQTAYPDAQIFAMTLLPENLYSADMTAWEQHNAYIRAAAEYYGIPVVDLAENCAITWDNYSGYMMDKIHPTTAGMELISDCIEAELQAYYKENLPHAHTYENGICTGCGHIAASGIWQIIENGKVIGAFSALADAVDACREGGTICLTADCSVTSGVVLRKALTIDGGGYLVDISGCSEALITVNEGVSVTLRNLRLDGGATGFEVDYDGVTYTNYTIPLASGSLANDPKASQSAIISSGTLICENVDISNRYTASVGGAMQILAGSASLTNCDFAHNYGTSKGGALFIGSNFGNRTAYPVEQVTISGCTFTGNYSGHGGAIYAYNVSVIDIADSEFVSNTANGGKGGAIDLFSETTKPTNAMALGLDFIQTTIRNCSFRGNWAGNDGFAIQSYDSDLYIYDSEFIENVGVHPTSSVGTVSIEAYRHADESYRIYTLMDGCLFDGNRGPCAVYGDHSSISDLDVTDCVFQNNVGNMSFLLYAATSHISECQFIGEAMALGVIDARIYENYTVAPELTLTDVTFADCDAPTELLLRKHNHNTALNTYPVILEGATNGDITVWDSNCVTINGTHTGNVQFGYGSERENLTIGSNGKVNGIIFVQPESVQVSVGDRFAITVEAEGENLSYQWYYSHDGGKNFFVSSITGKSYALKMASYICGRQLYCVITDANGNSVTTDTVTVTAPLTIIRQPESVEVELGEKFAITVSAVGEGLTYQWYYSNNGGKSFAPSAFQGSRYAMTMASYCHNRQVYCVITDRYGNSVQTETVTITRPPVELKILEQPTDVYGAKGDKFSVSFSVQGEGLTYRWYYKESWMKDFKASSNTSSAYAYTMASWHNGRQVYCVITDQYGNQVTTEIVTIYCN